MPLRWFASIVERLTRPAAFSWVAHVTGWGVALFLGRHSFPVRWCFDALHGFRSASTRSELVTFSINGGIIFLTTLFSVGVCRVMWVAMVLARRRERSSADERRADRSPSLGSMSIQGSGGAALVHRAERASIKWNLANEEPTLCPLPDLSLARRELLFSALIGSMFIAMGLLGALEARPVVVSNPVRLSAALVVAGIEPLLFAAVWAGVMPFQVWSVSLAPGMVRVHGFWGESRACHEADQIILRCDHRFLQFHWLLVVPAKAIPWSLILPGRTIDLVVAALSQPRRDSPESPGR
jgi:hypothetical protein